MTQKEKAKRYDEALGRARKCLDEKRDTCFVRPDVIFPELAESEDERIRKALITYFISIDEAYAEWEGIEISDIIAWLEKQAPKPKWSEEDNVGNRTCNKYMVYYKNIKNLRGYPDMIPVSALNKKDAKDKVLKFLKSTRKVEDIIIIKVEEE